MEIFYTPAPPHSNLSHVQRLLLWSPSIPLLQINRPHSFIPVGDVFEPSNHSHSFFTSSQAVLIFPLRLLPKMRCKAPALALLIQKKQEVSGWSWCFTFPSPTSCKVGLLHMELLTPFSLCFPVSLRPSSGRLLPWHSPPFSYLHRLLHVLPLGKYWPLPLINYHWVVPCTCSYWTVSFCFPAISSIYQNDFGS